MIVPSFGISRPFGEPPANLTTRNELLGNHQGERCSTTARRTPSRPTGCRPGDEIRSDPSWMDARLAVLDIRMDCRPRTSKWTESADGGPRWSAGYRMEVQAETVIELCERGELSEAIEALEVLVHSDCHLFKSLFYAVLKDCVSKKDLPLGRRVHALTVKRGYESDTFLCNHFLRMYASHGRLQEAMDVFSMVSKPDAFTWSAIISAQVKHGQDNQAIQLYHQMRRSGVKPDGHVFVAALNACARRGDLKCGQQVLADMLGSGVEPNLFLWNCVVDMYAKCGSLEDAQRVFDGLGEKNVVTWSAMIAGYSQQGRGQEALHLYTVMQDEGIVAPSSVTFVSLLQACASLGSPALERGKELHAQIREQGHGADVFVGNSLVNMYAKCGSLEDARRVFEGLGEKNVVTWTTLIAGYSQHDMGQEALRLYRCMQEEGIAAPDSVTFACLLQACASVGTLALEKGKQLHAEIRKRGHQADVIVASSLVNMYAKCGRLEDARSVFDRLDQKNVVTWSTMIAAYSQQGMGQEALGLYSAMQEAGVVAPNSVMFLGLLQACASVGSPALEQGKQLHAQIREQGLEVDVFVTNGLVNMYAKCGSLEYAQDLFDRLAEKDVVTWNAMIAGYSQKGMGLEALDLYRAMQEEGLVAPDSWTFVCLLQACANVAALPLGRQLHALIKDEGLQADLIVAGSLINMYAKCSSMADAQQVFEAFPERDVVAWNALMAGYTRQGDSKMVFDLFHRMEEDGILPDSVAFVSVLTVCSHTGLVTKGREYFEAMSRRYGIHPTVKHYSCMVDLLGRAGQLDESLALIRAMPVLPDAAVWSTLLGACQKWSNVEVGRYAFDEAMKLDKKDSAAYVLMANIYIGAQMWEQAQDMQARRLGIGALKEPGQSWWTDMDGLVHSFSVWDKKHLESDASMKRLTPKFKKIRHVHLDSSLAD